MFETIFWFYRPVQMQGRLVEQSVVLPVISIVIDKSETKSQSTMIKKNIIKKYFSKNLSGQLLTLFEIRILGLSLPTKTGYQLASRIHVQLVPQGEVP